ncbi:hypothetical protein, partial [Lacticaseibacillus rhamnosus]|uniref:hypothetical protein n=1 Tax=Lacticaseibacillus rhamnosus TaxID=47715 RepID=UPI00194F8CF6
MADASHVDMRDGRLAVTRHPRLLADHGRGQGRLGEVVHGPRDRTTAQSLKAAAHLHGASLQPQAIDNETWFYDDKRGLLVVHEFRGPRNEY